MKAFTSHPGADLKINLETDHIILHGSTDEAAGVMLRGSVVLKCHEHLKVKAINLKFSGIANVHWIEGPTHRHYKDRKVIIEQEWQFLPKSQKLYHFDKGEQYHYDFELAIPGHLPATIHHAIGSLIYHFKAHVDRPTFSTNYTATKELRLLRTPQLTSMLFLQQQPQEITNIWADKVSYRIQAPSQIYWSGASIPVTFDIRPLCDHLKVKSVQMVLKQYIRFRAGDHQSTERKVLNSLCDLHFLQNSTSIVTDASADNSTTGVGWSKTEVITVPSNPSQVQQQQQLQVDDTMADVDTVHVDIDGDFMRVSHKLKVTVSLLNADGHVSELRVSIPITLIEMVPEEDASELPAYEDSWKYAPYYPCSTDTTTFDSDSSSSASSSSSTSSSSTLLSRRTEGHHSDNRISRASSGAFSLEDEDLGNPLPPMDVLPWVGADLSRVPSYTTALRTGRLYSYSGNNLPSYDSIAFTSNTSTPCTTA